MKEILQTAYLLATGSTEWEILMDYGLGRYLKEAKRLLKFIKGKEE